jgi:hypothetical protein
LPKEEKAANFNFLQELNEIMNDQMAPADSDRRSNDTQRTSSLDQAVKAKIEASKEKIERNKQKRKLLDSIARRKISEDEFVSAQQVGKSQPEKESKKVDEPLSKAPVACQSMLKVQLLK